MIAALEMTLSLSERDWRRLSLAIMMGFACAVPIARTLTVVIDAISTIPPPVSVENQIRRMVETSLEAVALCGASLLSDAFAPVPSPSQRGFLSSSPQAEPSVQISCTGLPR
jgi:hypothetical protein